MRSTNYDAIAATYDRRYQEEDYSGIEQALLDFVGVSSGRRVLEVGCGTGHWLDVLTTRGVDAIGVDASAHMLRYARGTSSAIIQANAEHLPLGSASCDRVFCINALHHFSDKAGCVSESRRVLRPGGAFMTVALDPHVGTDRWWVYDYFEGTRELDLARYPSSEDIRRQLLAAGFEACVTREVQYIPGDVPAREALERGFIDQSQTSQLAILTDGEYHRGVERILAAAQIAEHDGGTLRLYADLRVYATVGTLRTGLPPAVYTCL